MKGYDNAIRKIVHELFSKGDIPFDALVGTIQIDNKNREALLGFDDSENHLDILKKLSNSIVELDNILILKNHLFIDLDKNQQ